MVRTVMANTIGECWLECIRQVSLFGDVSFDEDVDLKEILGLTVRINRPALFDAIIDKLGDKSIVAHTLDKFEKGVVMNNRPFTYADCIYNKNGVDQFEWIVNRLINKPESKSASICLLKEGDSNANLPCLIALDAKIRCNKLNLQFFFRSQNIVGRQYANLLALANLQYKLAKRLSVEVGFMSGYISSAHIYSYDYDFAKAVCEGIETKLSDEFYIKGPMSIRNNNLFR